MTTMKRVFTYARLVARLFSLKINYSAGLQYYDAIDRSHETKIDQPRDLVRSPARNAADTSVMLTMDPIPRGSGIAIFGF
jgi:hypothetical protein